MSSPKSPAPSEEGSPNPLNALLGATLAVGLGYGFFQLLLSMLANLPPVNLEAGSLTRGISILVRYLVVGSVSLMTFMFAMVGLGLAAYGVQLLGERLKASLRKAA
ncbi:DUF3082 domain-containing protein [Thermostichus vulcanus]|uniref:DUF3082 domain-containing protein n=1 Tax=Thermostichus vulcanus str. 'Rupite' TaxID=2813851 RepID=A0ABT0CF48_THEVL|nr:DUF3082 domain-containing protein [Thermostichus vulcanus]MCJ2544413.1 DUF3082 domain-containing protein [Thermostichus vulcanus str. 'Rupite']